MKHAHSIPVQPWMIDDPTSHVMRALNTGGAVKALFVGGCVRNAVLEEDVGDIDIATVHTPDEVIRILEGHGIKVVPTGIDHGTVTAVVDKKPFEITTLRKDVETDGRRAVVAFTDNWTEDAQRRDFTINTLLMDMDGHIYDPTGQGMSDIKARRVVFVGDPAQRIAEDYLRILRFFRFHGYYGQGAPDPAALAACQDAAGNVFTLSKERITQEFLKLMMCDAPAAVLDLMFEYNVLKNLYFQSYNPEILTHLSTFQTRYGLTSLPARLLALCGFDQDHIEAMNAFLLLPKVFQKDMTHIQNVLALPGMDNDHAVKVAVYRYGRTAAAQALMVELVQDRVMNGYTPQALQIIQNWDIPTFPVTGEDLMKEGYTPGPALGAKLKEMEQAWVDEGFKAT